MLNKAHAVRFLKCCYYQGIKWFGRDKSLIRKIKNNRVHVILNLHRVSPHANPFWNPLHPNLLDSLLKELSGHFAFSSFKELGDICPKESKVILSFDDGYYDFMEYALPIIHKYRIRSNMNIIPQCVKNGLPPWNVQLSDFLNNTPLSLINEIRFPGFSLKLKSNNFYEKERYGLKLNKFLKQLSREKRQLLWEKILCIMGSLDSKVSTKMMTEKDIKIISKDHDIGVHSYSHESMAFEKFDFFKEDFEQCLGYFKENLKFPFNIYAFPNGSYREEHLSYLYDKGIKHVLLVDEKYASCKSFFYPRLTIYGENYFEILFVSLGIHAKGIL